MSYRKRKSAAPWIALALGGVGLLGAGGAALWWFSRADDASVSPRYSPPPKGQTDIPALARDLPAGTKLTREHFYDLSRQEPRRWIRVPTDQVPPSLITSVGQLIGRVLSHDKPANYGFTEKDFLPRGSREGLVARIPAGKRALRLGAEQLRGVFDLQPGDRFDILATVAVPDMQQALDEQREKRLGAAGPFRNGALPGGPYVAPWERRRAHVHVLASDAELVLPVHLRQVPTQTSSLTGGTRTRTLPVQEVVLAVAPAEVALLLEALETDARLTCVLRSGNAEDPGGPTPEATPSLETPSASDVGDYTTLDVIQGSGRQLRSVPTGDHP